MILPMLMAIFILLAWGLFNPFAGLMGLMAIDMIQPGELYPALDALHFERVAAALVLFSLLLHQGKLAFPRTTKFILCFWLTMFLSVPLSVDRWWALQSAVAFDQTVFYHLLVINLVNTPRRFRVFLLVFVLLIGWLAAGSYLGFISGHVYSEHGLSRAMGMTSSAGDPNTLGVTLVSALPLAALLTLRGFWHDRLVGLAVGALSIWVVVLTGSRTSFLAMIFLAAAYTFSRGKRLLFLPVALAGLAILWQVMPTEYQRRYLSVEQKDNDESYIERKNAWHAGWRMFLDSPVTGVGAGQFSYAHGTKYSTTRRSHWLQPHSLYVQLIAELGSLGAATFLAYLLSLFWLNRSLGRELSHIPNLPSGLRFYPTACSLSLLVLLFAGYTGHSLYRTTWYMLGALSGGAQLIVAKLKQAEKETGETPEAVANDQQLAVQGQKAVAGSQKRIVTSWQLETRGQ